MTKLLLALPLIMLAACGARDGTEAADVAN